MNKNETMKKWKFFFSILKERDWLEEMAAQGWLLTDMKLGMHYYFKKTEPCEKVFEVERFAVSANPTVQELNARKFAIDVATQSGWEVITHDEDMNYYFMKDKAGDETDEFYDDEELRRERAERFRKRYSYEIPVKSLKFDLVISLFYIALFAFSSFAPEVQICVMWFFITFTILDIACNLGTVIIGQRFYDEFSLSREEWENRKRFSVKKRFKRVHQLRSFLQEKNESGLSFTGYDGKKYLFEKDDCQYNYFVDTRTCLLKRLKEQGIHHKSDSKDWYAQDPKWYEMSIANAEQYGLKPVAVINRNILIYKRPYSDAALPLENGNAKIHGWQMPTLVVGIVLIVSFILGYALGYLLA